MENLLWNIAIRNVNDSYWQASKQTKNEVKKQSETR